jgi:hypothetical protein
LDVLWNHGDSFQMPPIPRPYHGISWLENRGSLPYTYHRLTHLPGAHTAELADLDNDGDQDIVSSVFIPTLLPSMPNTHLLETVVWLEQVSPGRYQRYALDYRYPIYPTLAAADFDGDGDTDIAIGNFVAIEQDDVLSNASLTIFENCGHSESQENEP